MIQYNNNDYIHSKYQNSDTVVHSLLTRRSDLDEIVSAWRRTNHNVPHAKG